MTAMHKNDAALESNALHSNFEIDDDASSSSNGSLSHPVDLVDSSIALQNDSVVVDVKSGCVDATLKKIDSANDQEKLFKKRIHKQKIYIETLNEQIIQKEVQLMKQSRRISGNSTTEENLSSIEKQIKILEGRLNNYLLTFNKKVAENKELRRKIDEMRLERCRYDELYTKLEYDIQANVHQMATVLEEGQKKMKMRDKARTEHDTLQRQLKEAQEAVKFVKEEICSLQEKLKREYERDELHCAQEVKTACRVQHILSQKTITESTKLYSIDNEEFDDEKMLDEGLMKVKELTGVNDIDTLIKQMVELDDTNYSCFKNISQELKPESDDIQRKIADAKLQLQKLKCTGLNMDTNHQDKLLERKEYKLSQKSSNDIVSQCQNKIDRLVRTETVIQKTCEDLGVSIPCNLSASRGLTENIIMEYLASIEKKASEIIEAVQGASDMKSIITPQTQTILKQSSSHDTYKTKKSSCLIHSDDVKIAVELGDDEERPFTFAELRSSLNTC